MKRNRRTVKNWKPERVDDTPAAPHRYGDTYQPKELSQDCSYSEFVRSSPYQAGDVVYVQCGSDVCRKARILNVFAEKHGVFRDWRHLYKIQFETTSGLWSKLYCYTWPGHIQRGYDLAGNATQLKGHIQ